MTRSDGRRRVRFVHARLPQCGEYHKYIQNRRTKGAFNEVFNVNPASDTEKASVCVCVCVCLPVFCALNHVELQHIAVVPQKSGRRKQIQA